MSLLSRAVVGMLLVTSGIFGVDAQRRQQQPTYNHGLTPDFEHDGYATIAPMAIFDVAPGIQDISHLAGRKVLMSDLPLLAEDLGEDCGVDFDVEAGDLQRCAEMLIQDGIGPTKQVHDAVRAKLLAKLSPEERKNPTTLSRYKNRLLTEEAGRGRLKSIDFLSSVFRYKSSFLAQQYRYALRKADENPGRKYYASPTGNVGSVAA